MPECPGKGVSGFPQSRGAFLGGAACEGPRALRREHEAGPIGSRPLSPSPLFVLGGSCSPAAFVSQGWDEPARGKGLSGPQPPAPPRSLVELNIFKHTHINKSSRWVCDSGPPRFCNQAQSGGHSQKKKKKKKSIYWPLQCRGALVIFLFALPLLGLQGCPCPWGPRDSGLWFGKLAGEVFLCLLLREGRWEEEALGRGVQSLALVECETPGHHP